MYATIVLIFFVFYVDVSKGKQISFFYDMHARSADYLSKLTFFLIIATLLGTPATLGFFFKIIVFINVLMCGKFTTLVAVLLNLTLIIFYLQAVRHNQVQRKKKKQTANVINGLRAFSSYICLFLLLFVFLATVVCDIASALI